MASATHLFTRELDLLHIEKWEYKVEDKSILSRLYNPIWEMLARLVPRSVAPNVVTLCALVCVMQAFWLTQKYGIHDEFSEYHSVVCYAAALLLYLYLTLDSIDGKIARNTLNSSPLGEFFDHGCDNIAGTFIILTVLMLTGVETSDTMWYTVQALQLASSSVHISAFADPERKIRFGYIFSPETLLHVFIGLLITAGLIGTDALWKQTKILALNVFDSVNGYLPQWALDRQPVATADRDGLAEWVVSSSAAGFYWLCLLAVVTQVLLLDRKYFATKFGFLLSLTMRAIPAILLFLHITEPSELTLESILSDGLFLSILCSDIIVAKMANRDLHSLVPVIAMASVLSNTVIYAGVALYHTTVIFDMCAFLNLPILNPVINVYVFVLQQLTWHSRFFFLALT